MKIYFLRKTCLAVVITAAIIGNACQAQDQPADVNALPDNIPPGSPLAEVVKLAQAGVDADTIKSYVANSAGAFNLDADTIIFLKDEGLPSDLINTMMEHDKDFSSAPQPAAAPTPAAPDTTPTDADTAPPAAPVTVNYFNDALSPYGSWVDISGYGRCWRPTAVIYDSGWQPYCDRGHWVYTDCGWYWDSDYSWGITFHYGRWFHDPRWGWCWWPDTVWSASWVTWRYSDDYCGWAPLPPFTVYQPGAGFYYRGATVGAGFNFGLDADFFVFLPVGNICDRHPRSYCVARPLVPQIFGRTTIVNNFGIHDRFVMNGGIPVDRINNITHRDIRPVNVGEVRDARRQGWRGTVPAGIRNVNDNRAPGFNQPSPVRNQGGNNAAPSRPQTFTPPNNLPGNRNFNPSANTHPGANPPANNNPAPGTPYNRDRQNSQFPQSPDNAGRNQSSPPANEIQRQTGTSNNGGRQNNQLPANGVRNPSSSAANQMTPPQAGTPFIATPQPRPVAPAEQQRQALQSVRPPAARDLPPRGYNRPDNAPPPPPARNFAPANPPSPPPPQPQPQQPQSQPRSADHSSDQGPDKNKQNH